MVKPRYKRFLEELPLNNNKIKPAAIKAGYSEVYADKQGKILYNNAIKQSAKDIIEQTQSKEITTEQSKKLMCELLGLSREQVYSNLRKIATQDKDYSSAIKILGAISKELGIDLSQDTGDKITVPVLNIGITKTESVDNKGDIKEVEQV